MTLRQKLLSLILLPVILLTSISSYYAYYTAKELLQNQIYRTDQFKSETYSDRINENLLKYEITIKNVASIIAMNYGSNLDYKAIAISAAKADPDFLNVFVAFEDKNFFNSDGIMPPPGYDPTTREWYKKAIQTKDGKAQYSEPYISSNTNDILVTIGVPIIRDGRAIGVVAMDIAPQKILAHVNEMKTGQTGYVFVVDGNGNFLAHPQYKSTDQLQKVNNGQMSGFFERVKKEDYFTSIFSFDGKDRLYSARNIGNTPWSLCTSMEIDELFSSVNNMAKMLAGAVFFTLLILVCMIMYVIKDISKVLDAMKMISKELADGDFRDKARRVRRKDEFGDITDALVDMRTKLRHLLEQAIDTSSRLAAASAELNASTDQSAVAAGQVATSIGNVADGAEEQRLAVGNANNNIQTMAELIQNISRDISNVASNANISADKASQGNISVEKAIAQMKNIEKTVGSSAIVVQELGKRSNEIGQIVDTIASIAGQTNLLALNAAIEAARAGEHGRGFAVVAEEVRKLAEQSQESSGHIANLIREIQSETEKAVEAMNTGTSEVAIGSQAVESTGGIFREISEMISGANKCIQQIQQDMQSVECRNKDVVSITEKINILSQNAADEAQTVSAATQEQAASMVEMSTASQELERLAQSLEETVNKFKIK